MQPLHNVPRPTGETRPRPDHLSVFREFLGHLDRVARHAKRASPRKGKGAKRREKS